MVFFHINKVSKSDQTIKKLEEFVKRSKTNKVFILIYMEGCPPCIATRPEWEKLTRVLHKDFANRPDIAIVDIDTDLADNLDFLVSKPDSFPTIRFITQNGREVEEYNDSRIQSKDRTIDSFVEWIKLKTGEQNISFKESVHKGGRKSKSRKNSKTRKNNKNSKNSKRKRRRTRTRTRTQ